MYLWVKNQKVGFRILPFLLFFCTSLLYAQNTDSLKLKKKLVSYGTLTSYSVSLVGLNQLWYKDYPKREFHFFNDNAQWSQLDKVGHAYSTYTLSRATSALFYWAGYEKEKSAWYGSGGAFLFLSTIEIFDAYSEEWGFSWGDFVANTSGIGLFLVQEKLWQKQVLRLKFSYSPTSMRELRPDLLGENELQGVLKDYNGQTYWASINLNSLSTYFKPRWLNLAVGYGADHMLYAQKNEVDSPYNSHRKQWYLGPDVDFERIQTKKKWLKTTFFLLNCIKAPLPALLLENNQLSIDWFAY